MKLDALLSSLPGCRVKGRRDVEITGVAFDSRAVRPGNIFTAIAGERADGNDYAEEARERGAAAVVTERERAANGRITVVEVADSRHALAALSDAFFGSPSRRLEIIGVTGTNGKTTVCFLARQMLRAAGRKTALLGTIEYLIGERSIPASRTTPEAPHLQAMMRDAVNEGCDSLVMEVSSHALAQQRVKCVAFDVAVFTNLGSDHLDFHGERESYFAAKALLFRSPSLKRAVVNSDDAWGRRLAPEIAAPLLSYGIEEGARLRARAVATGPEGCRFEIDMGQGPREVSLRLLGRHNVSNALAAAGAALSLGAPPDVIVRSLADAAPVPGRLEEIHAAAGVRVIVDFAHTEDALECALLAVREGTRGRVILVFGCGGDRDRTKRAPMGRVAARLADAAIITSDNPRGEDPRAIIAEIAKGFKGTGKTPVELTDRREAIAAALAAAREGDVVLVAGKGHERTQEIGSTVVPFNDREVILELAGGEIRAGGGAGSAP